MSSVLRATHLIEFCTPSISYDRQVQAASQAFDEQMFEIIDATPVVIIIPQILALADSTLVDILAWQFHVDFYDRSKPLADRQYLVQNAIQWHMRKGTVQLVQDVLDFYFPHGTTLQEWYEYRDPLPPNYPIDDPDALHKTFQPSDVNIGADKFNITAHGLVNDQQIRFVLGVVDLPPGSPDVPSGNVLPTPLQPGLYYFVVNAATNSFQVSRVQGGTPVLMTDDGAGTNSIWTRGLGTWHDRYRFRVLIDDSIIDPAAEAVCVQLIEAYKPVSRWLDGFVRIKVSECDIGWAGMMLRFIYRTSEAADLTFVTHNYLLSGPTSGTAHVPSAPFTVALPTGGTLNRAITVTPTVSNQGGIFNPAQVTLSNAQPSATFTFTPGAVGTFVVGVTNDGGLNNPPGIVFNSHS